MVASDEEAAMWSGSWTYRLAHRRHIPFGYDNWVHNRETVCRSTSSRPTDGSSFCPQAVYSLDASKTRVRSLVDLDVVRIDETVSLANSVGRVSWCF